MKQLNIAIDAGDLSPASPVRSGISRIVRSFVQVIEQNKLPVQIDYYFFSHDKIPLNNSEHISYHQLPTRGFSSFFLPLSLHRRNTDVFIGFSQYIPRSPKTTKAILVIHDLAFTRYPKLFTTAPALITQTEKSVKRARVICCFSNSVVSDVKKQFLQFPVSEIHQLSPGLDHISEKSVPISTGYPFYLVVGVIKPIKRVDFILESFIAWKKQSGESHQLILIGNAESHYKKKLELISGYADYASSIIWKHSVSEEELNAYYQKAEAFLIASYEEGFCFPLFEALIHRTPVIALENNLFTEYAKQYTQIKLVKDMQTFITAISDTKQYAKEKPFGTIPTWKQFTNDLISLSQKIADNIQIKSTGNE